MRYFAFVCLAGFAAIATASCAPLVNKVTLEMQQKRVLYDSYSMLPPSGSDWIVIRTTPREQVFVRRPEGQPQYSAVFQVSIKHAERGFSSYQDLKNYIAEAHAREVTTGRFKGKTYAYTPDPQYASCVRTHLSAQDYGAPNKGDLPYLSLVGIILVCPHPDRPGLVIILDASQRAPESAGRGAFDQMVEPFLASLRFEKPLKEQP